PLRNTYSTTQTRPQLPCRPSLPSHMLGDASPLSGPVCSTTSLVIWKRTYGAVTQCANSDRRDIGNPITPECPLLEQDRQDARGLGSSVVRRNLEQSPSSLRQTGIA